MGLFDFINKHKSKKEVEKIFDKVINHKEASDLVNKAISYRELKRYDEAIVILKDVLKQYQYKGAIAVLGNTYRAAGNFDMAEDAFIKMLELSKLQNDELLTIEAYSNLGSLYYFNKNEKQKAIEYYNKVIECKLSNNDNIEKYNLLMSDAYRGLCELYAYEENEENAERFSRKCLELNNKVISASRILGTCLMNKFIKSNDKLCFVDQPVRNLNFRSWQKAITC